MADLVQPYLCTQQGLKFPLTSTVPFTTTMICTTNTLTAVVAARRTDSNHAHTNKGSNDTDATELREIYGPMTLQTPTHTYIHGSKGLARVYVCVHPVRCVTT